jgi:hypothetical protein
VAGAGGFAVHCRQQRRAVPARGRHHQWRLGPPEVPGSRGLSRDGRGAPPNRARGWRGRIVRLGRRHVRPNPREVRLPKGRLASLLFGSPLSVGRG